jgi:hypothetical protein
MTTKLKLRSNSVPVLALALGSCLFLSGNVKAALTLLTPGAPPESTPGAASLSGLTVLTGPGGPVDESSTISVNDLQGNQGFTAEVESMVLQDPSGGLDFAYQITNLTGPDSIYIATLGSFSGFTTNADFVGSGNTGTVGYFSIGRSSQVPLKGFQITLNYPQAHNDEISPGEASDWVVIQTNATSYDENGTLNLQSGGVSQSFQVFEPVVAVPEPVSGIVLALAGAALLVGRPKRISTEV